MRKLTNFIIGAALGAAAGVVINYLFAPARGTSFNQDYRSRLDQALEDGQRAADEHEAELRQQLAAAKGRPASARPD
jgi:gas vesicle protein